LLDQPDHEVLRRASSADTSRLITRPEAQIRSRQKPDPQFR
jgi:hypothetical protein